MLCWDIVRGRPGDVYRHIWHYIMLSDPLQGWGQSAACEVWIWNWGNGIIMRVSASGVGQTVSLLTVSDCLWEPASCQSIKQRDKQPIIWSSIRRRGGGDIFPTYTEMWVIDMSCFQLTCFKPLIFCLLPLWHLTRQSVDNSFLISGTSVQSDK